eukprot:scaffold127639_cov60-Phaeocystis_antarctica.AAC.2
MGEQWVGSSKGVKSLRACARCRVHQCRARRLRSPHRLGCESLRAGYRVLRRLRSPHRLGCVALALASIMPRSSVPIFSYADWPLLPTCPARGG